MQENKLGITFLLAIGKYFRSNQDFINVMRVNKKYRNLTEIYKYNPISDTSLFVNIKTQHLYTIEDRENMLKDMVCYVHWYKCNYDDTGMDDYIYYVQDDRNRIRKLYFNEKDVLKNVHIKDYNCIPVRRVNVPNIVKVLGVRCCKSNYNLEEISLSENTKILKNECFSNCINLTKIVIPYGVIKIKERCFSGCQNLCDVTLPFSLKEISSLAFIGTDIDNVTMSDTNKTNNFECAVPIFIKTMIEKNGVNCPNYYLDKEDVIRDNILLNKHLVIPEGILKIGRECFKKIQYTFDTIILPKSLKEISSYAFENHKLKKVFINSDVKINFNAFIKCFYLNEIVTKNSCKFKYKNRNYYDKESKEIINCDSEKLYSTVCSCFIN